MIALGWTCALTGAALLLTVAFVSEATWTRSTPMPALRAVLILFGLIGTAFGSLMIYQQMGAFG